MRNRAKCKKCEKVIESFHASDYVVCECEEIALDGGDAMRCFAKNWSNLIRVDDEDNEIVPEVVEKDTKVNALEMLKMHIESYDNLPEHAMLAPITHADHLSSLMIIYRLLRDLET